LLWVLKISSTPRFLCQVKLEVPCRQILRHVKDLLRSHGDEYTNFLYLSPILPLAPEISLLTEPPASTGGCQSALVDKLGDSPVPWSTSQSPGMNNRPVEAAVLRRQSDPIITNPLIAEALRRKRTDKPKYSLNT
jgi:hypothetical protein